MFGSAAQLFYFKPRSFCAIRDSIRNAWDKGKAADMSNTDSKVALCDAQVRESVDPGRPSRACGSRDLPPRQCRGQ